MIDYHRLNFDTDDEGVIVCKDNHEKGQSCEYEQLSPDETLEIINDLRKQLFEAKEIIALVHQSEWISVEEKLPNDEVQCRVCLAGYEQTAFYFIRNGKWMTDTDNGAVKASAFQDAISHYYTCPSPPDSEE